MTLVYGVDSSFDLLTLQEARRLADAGVRVFAQCLWTGAQAPSVRVESLRSAQAAGLILIGYIAVSPGRNGRQHVDIARDGIPEDLWAALVKTPIDVELEGLNYQTPLSKLTIALPSSVSRGTPTRVITSGRTSCTFRRGDPVQDSGTRCGT